MKPRLERTFRLAILVASLLSRGSLAAPPAPQDLRPLGPARTVDVESVRTGMTVDEAIAALKAGKVDFKITKAKGFPAAGSNLLVANSASADSKNRDQVQVFFTPTTEPVVYQVQRTITIGTGVMRAEALTGLENKYGKEVAPYSGSYRWRFNAKGEPIADCKPVMAKGNRLIQGCEGVTIEATMGGPPTGITYGITVTSKDANLEAKGKEDQAQAQAGAAAAKQQEAIDQAKSNKVSF